MLADGCHPAGISTVTIVNRTISLSRRHSLPSIAQYSDKLISRVATPASTSRTVANVAQAIYIALQACNYQFSNHSPSVYSPSQADCLASTSDISTPKSSPPEILSSWLHINLQPGSTMPRSGLKQSPHPLAGRGIRSSKVWHRAIFPRGNPQSIVAATAFHNRVREGSEWFHRAIDTRQTYGLRAYEKPSSLSSQP